MTKEEALDYCCTLLGFFADRLSEWEDTFVRDMKIRTEQRGQAPTEKQEAVLDRLMERCAQQYGRERRGDSS